MQQPNPNPVVTVTMDLNTFNRMQGILAKQPFEEISELIFYFRNQVGEQLREIEAGAAPTRLRVAGEADTAG